MSKFAYLDKGGILHISASEKTAKEYSKTGKVVKTEHPAGGGFPLVAGESIIVYSETVMKKDAKGEPLDASMYPQLAELYRKCK